MTNRAFAIGASDWHRKSPNQKPRFDYGTNPTRPDLALCGIHLRIRKIKFNKYLFSPSLRVRSRLLAKESSSNWGRFIKLNQYYVLYINIFELKRTHFPGFHQWDYEPNSIDANFWAMTISKNLILNICCDHCLVYSEDYEYN